MKEIKDFGEKIGGARKDVWALRGLILDDILKMTSGEKVKYIKRDNIWKKSMRNLFKDTAKNLRILAETDSFLYLS